MHEDIVILADEKSQLNDNAIMKDLNSGKNLWFSGYFKDIVAWMGKIKIKEKIIFYRLMATMLNAWMSLLKGVQVLEKQEKNQKFKKILESMYEGLREWRNLSECMDEFPASFSEAEIGVVRSGEKTWKLNEVMVSLADQVEKVASITWKLKSALIYPAMIMLVVAGVIFVMMTMVVPKLIEIFDDASNLPQSTQVLIFFSNMMRNYWYVIILVIFIMYFWLLFWKRTPNGKYTFDKFMLEIPVFWNVVQKVILSKFSRVFAWLMASWVSVVESLKIVSDAVWNEVYRQRILLLLEDVRQWMKIWESLEGDKLFPDMMVQMIQVGEQSAKLDTTIVKVADFYDEQVDNIASTINKLLEPFIIVFLAVVVWFIAMAIMQPIMNLADTIG